jgi:hypothetical protein
VIRRKSLMIPSGVIIEDAVSYTHISVSILATGRRELTLESLETRLSVSFICAPPRLLRLLASNP